MGAVMEKQELEQLKPVITYPRDAVLTIEQVAAGLTCSVSAVERADFPSHYIGRLVRFIWGEVLDALAKR
jgi:hypothetical protein